MDHGGIEMMIEIRNLGVQDNPTLEQDSVRTLATTLGRFEDHVHRVRVRFIPNGAHDATCRIRVWCTCGPTSVFQENGASSGEALHAVADVMSHTLRRRLGGRRGRARDVAKR